MNKLIMYLTIIYKTLTKKEKVYCEDCLHHFHDLCMNKRFLKITDTPTKPKVEGADCNEINKNNDCSYFISEFFMNALFFSTAVLISIIIGFLIKG